MKRYHPSGKSKKNNLVELSKRQKKFVKRQSKKKPSQVYENPVFFRKKTHQSNI